MNQSYVENFEFILNEENISQETNLININPHVIRLDTGRFASQVQHEPLFVKNLPSEIPRPMKPRGSRTTADSLISEVVGPGVNLQPKMVNFSVNTLKDEYPFILPHVYDRVRTRNVFIIDLYNKTKMIGSRVFDAIYLARYIAEKKIGSVDSTFKAIDDILARSDNFARSEKNPFEASQKSLGDMGGSVHPDINAFLGQPTKNVGEAPGKVFIKLKAELPQINKEELVKRLHQRFGLPHELLIVKEIGSSEIILTNMTVEEVELEIAQEEENYRRLSIEDIYSKTCYLDHMSDRLFLNIFSKAANNFFKKLCRLLREIEILIKEINLNLKDKLMSEDENEIRKHYEFWKFKPQMVEYEKFPRAKEFLMEPHLGMLGPTIKPFQKAMDKLFMRDKSSKTNQNQIAIQEPVQPIRAEDNEEGEVVDLKPVQIDLDYIQQMITAEKHKQRLGHSTMVSKSPFQNQRAKSIKADSVKDGATAISTSVPTGQQSANGSTENLSAPIPKFSSHIPYTPQGGKALMYGKQLKQIVGYGTMINSLQYCLERKVRDSASNEKGISSIADAFIPGRNYTSKVKSMLTRVKQIGSDTWSHIPAEFSADEGADGEQRASPGGLLLRILKSRENQAVMNKNAKSDGFRVGAKKYPAKHTTRSFDKQQTLERTSDELSNNTPHRIGRANVLAALKSPDVTATPHHNNKQTMSKSGQNFQINKVSTLRPRHTRSARSQDSGNNLFATENEFSNNTTRGYITNGLRNLHSRGVSRNGSKIAEISKEEVQRLEENLENYILSPF